MKENAETSTSDIAGKKPRKGEIMTSVTEKQNGVVRIVFGNIAGIEANAYVCAVKHDLKYSGGGVQDALAQKFRRGSRVGEGIFNGEESKTKVPPKSAHIRSLKTDGRTQHVILTVNVEPVADVASDFDGPKFQCSEDTLRESIRNVLASVEEYNKKAGKKDQIRSVAFPLLGTGMLGGSIMHINVPLIIVGEFQKYFKSEGEKSIEELILVATENARGVQQALRYMKTEGKLLPEDGKLQMPKNQRKFTSDEGNISEVELRM